MNHPVVSGNGPLDARLLIVGERPGTNEVRAKAPMVGATGAHVYHALGAAKPTKVLNRSEAADLLQGLGARITNARCYLDDTESDAERRAGFSECAKHLQEEFDTLTEARCVLAIGSDASWLLTGRGNMMKLHGSVWTRDEIEAMRAVTWGLPPLSLPPRVHTVICCYHPAFAMRGFPQAWNGIYKVIRRAKVWAMRENGPRRDFKFAWAFPAQTSDKLSIDIETPREQPLVINLVGVSATDDEANVFPLMGNMRAMREMLASGALKVGHNFAFDHKAFLANGLPIEEPIWDTIVAENLLRPPSGEALKRRWFALSTACQHWLEDWPYHKEANDEHTRAFYRASFPSVPVELHEYLYCGLDCIATRRLQSIQEKVMEAAGLL